MQKPKKITQKSPQTSNIDYKELQQTLIQFQKAQLQLEKTKNGSPLRSLSPLRAKELINFQALQEAGLIDVNNGSEQKKIQGIPITLEEIERAFKILDEKNNGQKISLNELKKKIPSLNPGFSLQDIPALTQGKNELKAKDLFELLKQNELENFDPLEEAFNLLDPAKTGVLDIQRLKQVFLILGYGDIDKRDIDILQECLDVDKDGKISVNDLREVFNQERNYQK